MGREKRLGTELANELRARAQEHRAAGNSVAADGALKTARKLTKIVERARKQRGRERRGGVKVMRLAIYARVSTEDQHFEAQLHALREYAARRGAEPVEYIDKGISGRHTSRPQLDRLLAAARRREVDAVAVVRLDRLARSLAHMAALGEELRALEVELVSLTEGIDTATPTGRALFGMCGVFAQLEVDQLRERTKAGLAAARRRGARLGRPPVLDDRQRARVRRLRASGKSLRQIATMVGCGVGTVRRALA